MKKYHMAPDVGHYGIFNGSKWRNRIAPVRIATHSWKVPIHPFVSPSKGSPRRL
jgi:poly-beta-hydroxyalkanoate depolymerase